ncbi:MAG TPA: efflux RND transporter periplasmic adaptor subunit [Thermoanaerobaculia bacterium]|nr:efflux RND transporter periplasmic adaptor subunit [Thermoanaerobaculia bacterium]
MKKALVAVAVVAVLGLIVWASLRGGGGEEGVAVDVEAVERRSISRLVKASGVVDPRVKVNLSAHVVGKIEQLLVEEGQAVGAGDPVLVLERQAFLSAAQDWQARLRQARLDVEQAEIDLADAQIKLQRAERLAEEGVVAREDLEAARLRRAAGELALRRSESAVRQASANLDKAQDDLQKTTVFSPLAGRVITLNAEVGETVYPATMNNPASVVATIADLSEVLAKVDVDETEVVHVEVGQDAELLVDALPDRVYRGRVVEIGSSGFSRPDQPDVTFFSVEILFVDPDPSLLPGMSVRAEVVSASHPDALVVPIQAVVERPRLGPDGEPARDAEEVPVVFAIEEGEARQRPVETGISDETHVELVSGLDAGAEVIVGPYRTLRDLDHGDPVHVEEDAERSGSAEDGEDGGDGGGDEGDDGGTEE